MRVTTQMIHNQTIFNLSRNTSRLMNVQGMMSTGRRINTPSDDPIGSQHDLNYRTRLHEIGQYKANIDQGMARMSFYEDTLSDLKNLYESAKLTATTLSNDTYTDVEREAAANEIESIYQQVLQLGNKQINGRYLYSGHRTRNKPLMASTHGVVFDGDTGRLDIEVDENSRIKSNLIGRDIFFEQLSTLGGESTLNVALTAATPVGEINLGQGFEQVPGTFEIYDANRDLTYTIDLSGAATVDDIITTINAALGAGGNLSVDIAEAGSAIVLSPVIGATNTVTDQTALSNLNGGSGVDLASGIVRIRNADSSIEVDVDISGATSLGDVRTTINNALTAAGVANVTVGFNADGTGLSISDTNGVPLGLVVEDSVAGSTTAVDLGIAGDVGASLEGRDLRPQPDFEIRDIGTQTTASDLGIIGTIHNTTVGTSIAPRLTLDSTIASLNNGAGFPMGEVVIAQGDRTTVVDLGHASIVTVGDVIGALNGSGLDITASINADETGIQIISTDPNRTLTVTSGDSLGTARSLGIEGSPDMLGSLLLLADSLRNNDREMAGQLIGNLDGAIEELLGSRASVGATTIHMETTMHRLESTEVTVRKMLSSVEDADIIDLVSELAREENLYQAALLASSKIIQPSLIDFLQ